MCSLVWLLVICFFSCFLNTFRRRVLAKLGNPTYSYHMIKELGGKNVTCTWWKQHGFFQFYFFFFTFKSIIPWGLRNQRVGHFFFQRAWLTYYDDVALIRHYRIMRRACDPWKRHQDAQKRFKSAPPYDMRRQNRWTWKRNGTGTIKNRKKE